MNEYYMMATAQYGWLIDGIEKALADLADGALLTSTILRKTIISRWPTDSEMLIVIEGLRELGIIENKGSGLRLNRLRLETTAGYRKGVREGLSYSSGQENRAVLCAALPSALPAEFAAQINSETLDLRNALVNLIAEAKQDIILASPFWDQDTAIEISELLKKRLEAGVAVTILGRFNDKGGGDGIIKLKLGNYLRSKLVGWYLPKGENRLNAETFHFKAASADAGSRAWVGSANFTLASLRSQMELGFLVSGSEAEIVHKILTLTLEYVESRDNLHTRK